MNFRKNVNDELIQFNKYISNVTIHFSKNSWTYYDSVLSPTRDRIYYIILDLYKSIIRVGCDYAETGRIRVTKQKEFIIINVENYNELKITEQTVNKILQTKLT